MRSGTAQFSSCRIMLLLAVVGAFLSRLGSPPRSGWAGNQLPRDCPPCPPFHPPKSDGATQGPPAQWDSYSTPAGQRHLFRLAGSIVVACTPNPELDGAHLLTAADGPLVNYRLDAESLPGCSSSKRPR